MYLFFFTVNNPTDASAIKGTISTTLAQIDMTQLYNLQVVCDINPTRIADYCEVFAHGPNSITGKYICMYSLLQYTYIVPLSLLTLSRY